MLKRSSAENSGVEPPAKKCDTKVDPIPRNLPMQSITLNFSMRTWEQVAPDNLYYLPLSQTIKYMMDPAMINQFKKFRGLWESMSIHNVHFKISNPTMLQDDLRVQSNTPTDATAFTQVIYMIHYVPKGQKQYFKLTNITDTDNLTGQTLRYNLKPKNSDTQLVTLDGGYTNFELLGILPARSNLEGGFKLKTAPNFGANGYTVLDPYISPNTVSTQINSLSGNLQPEDTRRNYLDPGTILTYAKNQDSIHFIKYGDTMSRTINTNLENIPLMSTEMNDFTEDVDLEITTDKGDTINYATEWAYPGRNRPFFSRDDYLSTELNAIQKGKKFKPLNHHFFMMPPIKKPNGATLGQRCSFMLEQHFSLTFKLSQAIFEPEDEDNDEANQIFQDDGVILRRNFYGKVVEGTVSAKSPFCGGGYGLKCETMNTKMPGAPEVCPTDDWQGIDFAMYELYPDWITKGIFSFTRLPQGEAVGPFNIPEITTQYIRLDKVIEEGWYSVCSGKGTMNKITFVVKPQKIIGEGVTYARYGEFKSGQDIRYLQVNWTDDVEQLIYVTLDFDIWWNSLYDLFNGITCSIIQKSDFVSANKDTSIFFS